MNLTPKQSGVAKGMALGFCTSAVVISAGFYLGPLAKPSLDETGYRATMLGAAVLLPTFALVLTIGNLARHRFFTPADIDGSGLTDGSEKAKLLQSLLQNTLEQFCIALGAYTSWCFLMPVSTVSVPFLCSLLFVLGRLLFYFRYQNGAAARAIGFTLTFYPTVLLVVILLVVYSGKIMS